MQKSDTPTNRVPDADKIAAFRHRPGVWLTFAGSAFLLLFSEKLRPLGLKPSWVTALAIISEQPGVTQSALGRALRINRASSMALAAQLENSGLVSRTAATGRQRTILHITGLGQSRLTQACRIEEQLVAATMNALDDTQRASFIEALKSVAQVASTLPSDIQKICETPTDQTEAVA